MVIFYSYENVYQRVDDMKTSHMIPLSFQPFGVLIPFGLPRRSVEKKNINGLMTNDDYPNVPSL